MNVGFFGFFRTFVNCPNSQFLRRLIHPTKNRQLTQANNAANTARIQRMGTLPVSPAPILAPTTAPTAMYAAVVMAAVMGPSTSDISGSVHTLR